MSRKEPSIRIHILSLFPGYFQSPIEHSMIKRARDNGIVEIQLTDIRDFAEGKHRIVDDRPYGGGPGMVMMAEPVVKAIRHVRSSDSHVVYMSPQGKPLSTSVCERLAPKKEIVILCGHYEGIDERALESEVDEEVSVGDYVLTSGCAAALVFMDALLRFVPCVLGNEEAAKQDSFATGLLDCPHYTRPEVFEGREVPKVLLSGNHKQIANWRKEKARIKTGVVRPDLLNALKKS